MTTIVLLFVMALGISVVVSRISISVSNRFGLVDVPDQYRKLHGIAVARLGGPALFLAFFAPLVVLLLAADRTNLALELLPVGEGLLGLYVGASMALLVGLMDDQLDLLARWKLLGQTATALVACSCGLTIHGITNPLGGGVELGVLSVPITVFWFVACMNAVNLVDGMDGLAAGICLFADLAMFFISMVTLNALGMVLSAVLAGAILGFLVFNFPPARLFLGNSGSNLLGFLIAALSILALQKAQAALALFVPIVALGLPIADTSLAVLRRWYRKVPISTPDREHIHHVLVRMGFSHRRAVLILYSVCVVLTLAAVLLGLAQNEVVVLVIVFLGAMVYAGFRMFGGVSFADMLTRITRESEIARQRLRIAAVASRAAEAAETAGTVADAWKACWPLFEALGLLEATFSLGDAASGREHALRWPDTDSPPKPCESDSWNVRLVVRDTERRWGELAFGACSSSPSAQAMAVEYLDGTRNALARACARTAGRGPLRRLI